MTTILHFAISGQITLEENMKQIIILQILPKEKREVYQQIKH